VTAWAQRNTGPVIVFRFLSRRALADLGSPSEPHGRVTSIAIDVSRFKKTAVGEAATHYTARKQCVNCFPRWCDVAPWCQPRLVGFPNYDY
jgi:hypothetical protein